MGNPKVGAYLACFRHNNRSEPLEEHGLEQDCGRGGTSQKEHGVSSERNLEPLKHFELRSGAI